MIDKEVQHTESINRVIGDRKNSVTVTLSLHPSTDSPTFKTVSLVTNTDGEPVNIRKKQLQALNNGVSSALKYGRYYAYLTNYIMCE